MNPVMKDYPISTKNTSYFVIVFYGCSSSNKSRTVLRYGTNSESIDHIGNHRTVDCCVRSHARESRIHSYLHLCRSRSIQRHPGREWEVVHGSKYIEDGKVRLVQRPIADPLSQQLRG